MAHFFSQTIGICVLLAAFNPAQAQRRGRHMPPQQDGNGSDPQSNASQPSAPQTYVPQYGAPIQQSSPFQGGNVSVPQSNASQSNAPQTNIPQYSAPGAPSPVPAAPQPIPNTPAVPPVVTYRDGFLTVQAINSNLSAVISAIRSKAGIEFEGTEGVYERVAISLGPAPEGEVLSAIFSGSRYDFMAIGRADSPTIVQRVILTPRDKTGNPAETRAQQGLSVRQPGEEEEATTEEQQNSGDPQDTAVQPVLVPEQPPQAQNQQQPKSPEQLLQELQQMRRLKGSPPDDPNGNTAPRKPPR